MSAGLTNQLTGFVEKWLTLEEEGILPADNLWIQTAIPSWVSCSNSADVHLPGSKIKGVNSLK